MNLRKKVRAKKVITNTSYFIHKDCLHCESLDFTKIITQNGAKFREKEYCEKLG